MGKTWYVLLVLGLVCWAMYGVGASLSTFIKLEEAPLNVIMIILSILGIAFFGVGGYVGIRQAWESRK